MRNVQVPWTKKEEKKLKELIGQNASIREIGQELKRSMKSVEGKTRREDLTRKIKNTSRQYVFTLLKQKAYTEKFLKVRYNVDFKFIAKHLKTYASEYEIYEQRNEWNELVITLLKKYHEEIKLPKKKFSYQKQKDGEPYLWIKFPKNAHKERIKILPLADVHYGHKSCDVKDFKNDIEYIKNTPGVYTFLNGDMIENANKLSIGGGVYEQDKMPNEQIHDIVEMLAPISDKILWSVIGNHECLSEDTEVLTNRGWKNYKELKKDDRVLSMKKDKSNEWVDINKIHEYDFDGELNRVFSSRVDMLITDNHKLLFKYTNSNLRLKELQKFKDTHTRIHIPISSNNTNKEYPISDEEIKIIAWIFTDGYYKHTTHNKVNIYQSGEKHKIIKNILDKLGWSYLLRKRNRNITHICGKKIKSIKPSYEFDIHSPYTNEVEKLFGDTKKVIPKWADKLSKRQFDIFLEHLILGDGSVHKSSKTSRMFYVHKTEHVNRLQALLSQNGYASTVSEYRKNQYRINICPRIFTQLSTQDTLYKHITKEKYKGKVWCLSVKNENFLVRRNGKVFFTGNSRAYVTLGIDIAEFIAQKLEVPYFNEPVYVDLLWKKYKWTLFGQHGASGALTKGGKLNAAAKPIGWLEFTNFVVMSHVHDKLNNEIIRITRDPVNFRLQYKKQYVIVTGSYLKHFNTYGARKGYSPTSKGRIAIKLYSDGKYFISE